MAGNPFSKSDLERISQVITEAEKKTSAEIIPMVARRSAPIGQAQTSLFLFTFAMGLLLMMTLLLADVVDTEDHFLMYMVPALFIGSYGLSFLLVNVDALSRIFIHKRDLYFEVCERAELEFYRRHFDHTKSKSAVLIYISLFERRAVVIADPQLASLFPAETWAIVVRELVQKTKQSHVTDGLIHAIEKASAILSEKLPSKGKRENEIANQLIFIEE